MRGSTHLPLLRQLCAAVGMAERARAELEEGELCVRGSRGATLHPAFGGWSQAVALVARLSVEFGGSPAALTHIGPSQLRGKSLQQELAERYRTAPPCGAGSRCAQWPISFWSERVSWHGSRVGAD
jgi:hypothetical protein